MHRATRTIPTLLLLLALPGLARGRDPERPARAEAGIREDLSGRWRFEAMDERHGFVAGEVCLERREDGSYRYLRRYDGDPSLPPALQGQEQGVARVIGGRLMLQAGPAARSLGFGAAMSGAQDGREAVAPRRDVFLCRPDGSLQGIYVAPASESRGKERLTRLGLQDDNAVELLVDGRQMFPRLREALSQAQRTICMQTFIYSDDATGRDIGELLCAKARAGVKVLLLVDAAGDRMGRRFERTLRDAGVELIVQHKNLSGLGHSVADVGRSVWGFFRRLFGGGKPAPREKRGLLNHDHRKITVVDGRIGFTGGMNIADEYEHEWHDIHARVEGSACRALEALFFDRWRAAGGKGEVTPAEVLAAEGADRPAGRLRVDVVASLPGVSKAIKERYLAEIKAARRRILIEMAYFLDDSVLQGLQEAAARGVRSLVILPPDENHDVPVVRDAFAFVQDDAVRAGIELYKLRETFTHAKVATFDGLVGTVGSSNLDPMALNLLAEANLFIPERAFARELDRRVFAVDVPRSRRVQEERRSWFEKVRSFGLHAVRGVL